VHAEAERLEHAVSDELIERMAERLGNPKVDPHGDPIPSRDGEVPEVSQRSLDAVAVGRLARVTRVAIGDDDRLRYLATLGLVPGREVEVRRREPFDGPIVVTVDGAERIVAHDLARLVFCEPVKR
jgi:DtxR family Mn-dependent transcriptional regulator